MISKRRRAFLGPALLILPAFSLVMLLCAAAAAQERIPFPKPDTHRGAWIENHGLDASMTMGDSGASGRLCLTCHVKSDCISCHATRLPRDHNNYWREKGHGLSAGVNRERCFACHRQDYCVRCHNETAPRSHTASWVSRHCGWCHYAAVNIPEAPCGVCHRLAPHTSAPAGHSAMGPQSNCLACH